MSHPLPTEIESESLPASRIMRERSHWQDLAEKNQARILDLVRENETLRISRDTARASSDRHYAQLSAALEQTGISKSEAASARAELRTGFAAHEALKPAERIELEALRARVARMELREKKDAGTIGDLRDTLEDVLKDDVVGKDCESCNGHGGHGDDLDNWDACDAECFGGRVPR